MSNEQANSQHSSLASAVQLKDPWTADKSLQSGQLNMQNMAFFLRANTKANIHLLADLLGAPVQFLLNANI